MVNSDFKPNAKAKPLKFEPEVPIYQQLVDHFASEIIHHRLQPGDRVDSIAEIQEKYGVARETAKRVLSILKDQGYIVQQRGKGSFVAERRAKQKVWGVVVPFFSVQYEDLMNRLTHHAESWGRELRCFYDYNNWEEEIRLVGMMQSEHYEAIIVVPTLDESRTWTFYSRLTSQDSPVILFDHTMTYRDFNFVVQSYDLGVYRALKYLSEQRPGNIAFVKNEGWTGRNMVLDLMIETYQMFMRCQQPAFEPFVVERASLVNAYELKAAGVTGVFCCDDLSAVQVLGRLREQGVQVPRDMRLASYGNTDLARFFTPGITSVDPHNEEMALRLIQVLAACAAGREGQPNQHVVQPSLIVRET